MPKQLIEDLANPKIKWIIFINPPFATSNNANKETGKQSKYNVSMTKIRQVMTQDGLGETSRELFAQYLYRIYKEFKGKTAYLGLFSKLKYLSSNNDQKLRDNVFKYEFKNGFMFSSEYFYGSKGKFPIGFLVWDLSKQVPLESQKIVVDVFGKYEGTEGKYGVKQIQAENRDVYLSKWVNRPKAQHIMPPFSSAVSIGKNMTDTRNRVSDGFLCSLMCGGNDFQHQNSTALLSGPYVSAGAFSVTAENFTKSMIIHTVRRLPLADWTNDRDQFYQPSTNDLSEDFIIDCVIWSAFSDSNNTVSMKDVNYNGKTYQIINNLYPYTLSMVKSWKCHLDNIELQIISANEDRFLANWLLDKTLSTESQKVFNLGKQIYEMFYENVHNIHWGIYKIGFWDVGWWQVRQSLKEVKNSMNLLENLKFVHNELGAKLLLKIKHYGFIRENVTPL